MFRRATRLSHGKRDEKENNCAKVELGFVTAVDTIVSKMRGMLAEISAILLNTSAPTCL